MEIIIVVLCIICIVAIVSVEVTLARLAEKEKPVLINVEYDENCPYLLQKAHEDDACWDIKIPETTEIPQNSSVLNSGFRIELPKGYHAFVLPRSGNDLKGMPVVSVIEGNLKDKRIHLDVKVGTIDCGFTKQVGVIIRNHYRNKRDEDIFIKGGTAVAQLMIQKLPRVELNMVDRINRETERGEGGFGSTDTK